MAHSPEKRAEAVADYFSGMTWEATCDKHGVSKDSLVRWVNAAKTDQKATTAEIQPARRDAQQEQFNDLLTKFLVGSLEMLVTWTEVCKDKGFVKLDPKGANELGSTVLERADRLVALIRPKSGPSDFTD